MWLLLALLLAGAALALRLWLRRARDLPPGPWGLPVLGYLPWLDRLRPHETLAALALRYGPIFTVPMGGVTAVVLAEEALVRTALAREACSGRAPLYLTHGLMQGHGLICAEGPMWRDQRRLRRLVAAALKNLGAVRSPGPRRDRLQERVCRGVRAFVQSVTEASRQQDGVVDPHAHLTEAVGNVVNSVVFGRTWAPDDPTWLWLQRIQDEGTKLIGVAGAINFLPFLRLLPQNGRAIRWLKEGQRSQHGLYAELVAEVRSGLGEADDQDDDGCGAPDNLLTAWLRESARRPDSPFYTDRQLHYLLADLFGAALDTTVTTLRWLLLFVAANPVAQERVHRELDAVLGGREPTLDDQAALPYTQATIMETQRIRSVTPLGIPHGVVEDTTLDGFRIPKGTMLVPLQWAIHMDPQRWDRPDEFRPERFLAEDETLLRPDGFIPFQTGKRMCVGDEWARMMLFLFSAGMLQRLQLSLPDGVEADLEGVCGITLTPKDQALRCVERQLRKK
ncbi:Cytochrome P450 CYP306 [Frankliniella occidentalis]|nr:Cytochrome P450 CYP306 [Frankliniella occidentalis]